LTASDDTKPLIGDYEVAVAIVPGAISSRELPFSPGDDDQLGPGFDVTSGTASQGRHANSRPSILEKGDAAVSRATEAIARQIGLAAQRIAESIDTSATTSTTPGMLALESVQVSFGVTLAAGLQTLFTAKSESSAEVTIILSRRTSE
jgi:hypothetical protein